MYKYLQHLETLPAPTHEAELIVAHVLAAYTSIPASKERGRRLSVHTRARLIKLLLHDTAHLYELWDIERALLDA